MLPTDFMGVYSIISAAINATKLPLVMRPLTIRKLPKPITSATPMDIIMCMTGESQLVPLTIFMASVNVQSVTSLKRWRCWSSSVKE